MLASRMIIFFTILNNGQSISLVKFFLLAPFFFHGHHSFDDENQFEYFSDGKLY